MPVDPVWIFEMTGVKDTVELAVKSTEPLIVIVVDQSSVRDAVATIFSIVEVS